jgi:ribosomal protein S18 acetylase RimI-like enzyme
MSADLNDLVQLDKSHIKPAAEALTQAFSDYPVLLYYLPDELQRDRLEPYFFQMALYYCLKYGEIYTTSADMEGVAVWLPSDNYPMTFWRLIRSVPLSVILNFGSKGGSRLRTLGEHIDTMHKRLTPFRHWYLETIGVAPQFQGKGYAGKLLRPMLARLDKEGLPCYLDTNDERRVSLYEHFRFEVLDKSIIPGTDLTNWAMLRKVGK